MIEKQFINQKMKEFQIQQYIRSLFAKTGFSHSELKRTPLGDKVIIYTSRPGLVVGKKGENINKLTLVLKKKFKMENPQVEIGEITNPNVDVDLVADGIAANLERFGSKRFKSIGYKSLQNIIDAGAMGAEITLSGKLPSSRAKTWRFSAGYLKKSGDIAENFVKKATTVANLKSGIVGIKVKIMTADTPMPDKMVMRDLKAKEAVQIVELVKKEEVVKKKPVKRKPKKIKEELKITEPKIKEEPKPEIKEDGNNKEK